MRWNAEKRTIMQSFDHKGRTVNPPSQPLASGRSRVAGSVVLSRTPSAAFQVTHLDTAQALASFVDSELSSAPYLRYCP